MEYFLERSFLSFFYVALGNIHKQKTIHMPAPIFTFHLAFIAKDNAGDGGGDSGPFTEHQLHFSLVFLRKYSFFIFPPLVL